MDSPIYDVSDLQIKIARKTFSRNKLIDAFRGKKGLPTPKQFLFVRYLFEGVSPIESYHKAGYKHISSPSMNWKYANRVMKTQKVQILIGLVLEDYVHARRITVSALINEALKTYDRCDNAREQLDCLKFIAKLSGK
jgi:hypothetical protein